MESLINMRPSARAVHHAYDTLPSEPTRHSHGHSSPHRLDSLEQRVTMLEEGIETSDEEMYRINHDFKVLLVEVSLVLDWLKEKFGVELINKESQIYKHIHYDLGSDEITAMKRSLSVPQTAQAQTSVPGTLTAKSEGSQAPSKSTNSSIDAPDADSDPNLVIAESDAEPDDEKVKDPDFDATTEGGSLIPKTRKSKRIPKRRERSGSRSSNGSSDSINVHHQRSAWRRRSRSRARRAPTQSHSTTVTPFVRKLWRMVDDPETNSIIEWSTDGEGFQIHDQFILAQDLLPFNFKHNNIASFVRQLNWYGFRKYPGLDAECRFVHKNFRRGRSDLLIKVRRRVADADSRNRRRASPSLSPSPLAGQQDQEQERAETEDPLLDLEEMEEVSPYDPGAADSDSELKVK